MNLASGAELYPFIQIDYTGDEWQMTEYPTRLDKSGGTGPGPEDVVAVNSMTLATLNSLAVSPKWQSSALKMAVDTLSVAKPEIFQQVVVLRKHFFSPTNSYETCVL